MNAHDAAVAPLAAPRGAPDERVQGVVKTLLRDGRKLRAVELLLSVRSAQVVAMNVASCAKLASVAADLDRVVQRAQRTGYRRMDHALIAAVRALEDRLAQACAELSEETALLAVQANVDADVLIDPLVRRHARELARVRATAASA
jgi:hypothetical protein